MSTFIRRIPTVSDRIGKIVAIGNTHSVTTDLRPLFSGTDVADITANIQSLIATPAQVKIASTSGDDVLTSGTGAWVVQVTGLDENLEVLIENVNLNGQTAVATSGTFYIVTKLEVIEVGTGGSNVGSIWSGTGTFTAGVPAAPLINIELGTNVSAFCAVAVPAGKSFVCDQLTIFNDDATQNLNFQFYQYNPATGIWYETFDVHGKQSSAIIPISALPGMREGSIMILRCAIEHSNAKITGSIAGYLK